VSERQEGGHPDTLAEPSYTTVWCHLLEGKTLALLELRDVSIRYGPLIALRGVDLTVEEGEIVTLLGANGAGKTTCLEGIVGILPKASGSIVFDGEDITKRPPEHVVRRSLTLVREGRKIFADLTVADNLRLGGATTAESTRKELLDDMLELFPVLRDRYDAKAGQMSGGEQQQLAVARALMSQPKLLLLDEPSLGLAPLVVASVFELIAKLRERGVTILLVEQNIERALEVADRGYVLSTGRVRASGRADELGSKEIEEIYLGLSAEHG
jgi:branched-chain amino acid transport system ATP-binding protein